jgi:uncharacterized protein (UPF0332 family)
MQNDKRHFDWCLQQSKGIRIVTPSDNLVKAYREKAKSALKSMQVNAQADLVEWAVSASYYAKYFAVYALLMKIGVKCEINDCTITLFEILFCDNVPKEIIKELRDSKADRVEMQYYTPQISVDLEQVLRKTKKFVLEIESIIDGLTSHRIMELQKRLKDLASK